MYNDSRQLLAATEEAVGAYVDAEARRMAPIPGSITNPFDRVLSEHRRLGWDAPVCGIMKP